MNMEGPEEKQPPMNADKRRWEPMLIGVYRRSSAVAFFIRVHLCSSVVPFSDLSNSADSDSHSATIFSNSLRP